jgi:hypothetical protein
MHARAKYMQNRFDHNLDVAELSTYALDNELQSSAELHAFGTEELNIIGTKSGIHMPTHC